MLKTATLSEVSSRQITKRQGHLVVTTRYYPRYFPRESVHEYISALAPVRELLRDFKNAEKKLGHNGAFKYIGYNRRFTLDAKGLGELQRLSELAREKDVYLICFCSRSQCCHRDLLLLTAQALFGASIESVKQAYPGFDPSRMGPPSE